MRILSDECSPKPLAAALKNFEVFTVEAAGLKGLKNGELLAEADKRYDVLITADKNLRYRQNLIGRHIAIIELPFNSWKRLRPLVETVNGAIRLIKPGQYIEIPANPTTT